jgi:hypothetical protein
LPALPALKPTEGADQRQGAIQSAVSAQQARLPQLGQAHLHGAEVVGRVRQRADAWGKIGPLKTKTSRRDIPMTSMVVNVLKEWKLACPKGPLGLVFPNGAGNVESHANIVQRGIGQGLHRFQHFFAS